MRKFSISALLFLVFLVPPASVWAAVQRVQVANSADVFQEPDFGSTKVERVEAGTIVRMQTDKRVGLKGIGIFYRIKTPSGKIGFIADADLLSTTPSGELKAILAPPPAPKAPKPLAAKPVTESATVAAPQAATIWALSAGYILYSEDIRGTRRSAPHYALGFRRWGTPFSDFKISTDFGFYLIPGAPKFLSDAGAFGDTSGYQFLYHGLVQKTIKQIGRWSSVLSVGLELSQVSYKTQFATGPYKSNKYRVGAAFKLGIVYDLADAKLRADLFFSEDGTRRNGILLSYGVSF